jgi:hypothetical protein
LTCSNLINFNLKAYNCIDVEALVYSFHKFFAFHPYSCIFLFTHIYVTTLTPLLEENVAIDVHVINVIWDMKMSQFKSKDIQLHSNGFCD